MESHHTCGKGLAERSPLPAHVARLLASLGEVLSVHMTALDPQDEHAREERAAYARLEAAYRDVAAEIDAAAREMAAHADLPMGRHDLQAMSGSRAREVFAAFVKAEEDLLALLQPALERDRTLLLMMREAARRQG